MRIIINPGKEEVGQWSADYIINKINKFTSLNDLDLDALEAEE